MVSLNWNHESTRYQNWHAGTAMCHFSYGWLFLLKYIKRTVRKKQNTTREQRSKNSQLGAYILCVYMRVCVYVFFWLVATTMWEKGMTSCFVLFCFF